MTFKMKDDFELPVKKTPGGVIPFLKDAAGDVIFVGSDKHVRAAVVAINAYDANQQEISELKASHRNELSKVNSDVQHILSTGVTIAKNLDGAASEIECLKNQVSQLKSEHESMAAYAEQRINMLTRVNNKLQAMIDEFIEEFSCFVAQHECNCGHPSCRTCKECRDAFKVLDNAVKLREGKS